MTSLASSIMIDLKVTGVAGLSNFAIGCVGAIAPEAFRLYNLRTQTVLRWSGSYLMFSIPFIFIGGFVAWVLEPTTKWAAFYSGLTAPVLLTTAMRDAAKAQKDLTSTQAEIKELEQKLGDMAENKNLLVKENYNLRLIVERLEAEKSSTTREALKNLHQHPEHPGCRKGF